MCSVTVALAPEKRHTLCLCKYTKLVVFPFTFFIRKKILRKEEISWLQLHVIDIDCICWGGIWVAELPLYCWQLIGLFVSLLFWIRKRLICNCFYCQREHTLLFSRDGPQRKRLVFCVPELKPVWTKQLRLSLSLCRPSQQRQIIQHRPTPTTAAPPCHCCCILYTICKLAFGLPAWPLINMWLY